MSITQSVTHGGSFFSRVPESIFTVEQFKGDESLMIDSAEQFSRKEIVPVAGRIEEKEPALMPKLIAKAGELGFCGVDTPEAYGGLGLGKNLAGRILEFLSLNGSFSVTIGVTSGIGQLGISLFGTEEQKGKYLPDLASGKNIGAYALSEPNSGSDALSATTRADFKNGKWVLNGTKMWISNAAWAEIFVTMAKVDGDKFSAFIVERGFPGVSISREEHKLGLRGSSTARLVLEDAEVPEENLLHQIGKGHQVALNALNIGRFKLSPMSMGPARDAIGLGAGYALDRRQFGRSISDFGLIRQKLVSAAARFYTAESATYRTGALIDSAFGFNEDWSNDALYERGLHCPGAPSPGSQAHRPLPRREEVRVSVALGDSRTIGEPSSDHARIVECNMRAAEEYAIECSACKVLASEAEAFIVDEMLQIFGGYGFTEEFPIARHYRDARVSRIYEGTNEINRVFLSDRLLRRAKEGRVSLDCTCDSFIAELAARGMGRTAENQIVQGAQSDLLILMYAEQSARLRARQVGGLCGELHAAFSNWANVQAALAFQVVTGEAVALPAPLQVDYDGVAEAVLRAKGPL